MRGAVRIDQRHRVSGHCRLLAATDHHPRCIELLEAGQRKKPAQAPPLALWVTAPKPHSRLDRAEAGFFNDIGGGGGIRTPGTRKGTTVFKTHPGAFPWLRQPPLQPPVTSQKTR